jgi:lipoyl(octanoyl) transferase
MDVELYNQGGLRALWLGRTPYAPALARQERLAEALRKDPANTPETLLLLEHEPVFTIGRTQDRSSLADTARLPFPVETVHRGGQATYHGPGQLVGYAILDLARRGRDLHRYLRVLEEVLISAMAGYGVIGERQSGLTGVWTGSEKIASIGVGVRRWVSMHGFAINVVGEDALAPFEAIIPCGIPGTRMTALDRACGNPVGVEEFAHVVTRVFARAIGELLPLEPPGEGEHDEDNQHQAQTAAGVIPPGTAVRPGRQRSQEKQDQ